MAEKSKGFTDEERSAMKERAQELTPTEEAKISALVTRAVS
jgi:hypothetical protein